jgi:hypothetical protein
MFSRDIALVPPIQVSDSVLPARGSSHPGFVEMLFLWGDLHDDDQRFRRVILPSGFLLVAIDQNRWSIADQNGFTRAEVHVPAGRSAFPHIRPMKRFDVNAESTGEKFRGLVSDWSTVVYRTTALKAQSDALAMAKKWLDDNKPGWDSHISAVNFERRPTG